MPDFNIDHRLRHIYDVYPAAPARPLVGITCDSGGEDFRLRRMY